MSIFARKTQKMRPGHPQDTLASRLLTGGRGGFSLGGHRLSSLYRGTEETAAGLTSGYRAAFSLPKYSKPADPQRKGRPE
ncbi:MAG: hypothetical protein U1E48_04125 [Paracoccaceae bacterium]